MPHPYSKYPRTGHAHPSSTKGSSWSRGQYIQRESRRNIASPSLGPSRRMYYRSDYYSYSPYPTFARHYYRPEVPDDDVAAREIDPPIKDEEALDDPIIPAPPTEDHASPQADHLEQSREEERTRVADIPQSVHDERHSPTGQPNQAQQADQRDAPPAIWHKADLSHPRRVVVRPEVLYNRPPLSSEDGSLCNEEEVAQCQDLFIELLGWGVTLEYLADRGMSLPAIIWLCANLQIRLTWDIALRAHADCIPFHPRSVLPHGYPWS